MATKIGRFLQICFGCHARPDRSFFFHGKQFPICARCTGELAGMITGIPMAVLLGYPGFQWVLLLMVPMLLDGFVQLLTPYESGNYRRLFTGFLFGIALVFAFIYFHRTCIWIAGGILKWFGMDPVKVDWAIERLS